MVTSVTIFQGQLYLGTEHDFGKTSIWRTSEGTQWEKVLDFYELGEKFNYYVWRLMPFNGKLYVGTANLGSCKSSGVTGAQIWVSDSGAAGTFYNLVHKFFQFSFGIIFSNKENFILSGCFTLCNPSVFFHIR